MSGLLRGPLRLSAWNWDRSARLRLVPLLPSVGFSVWPRLVALCSTMSFLEVKLLLCICTSVSIWNWDSCQAWLTTQSLIALSGSQETQVDLPTSPPTVLDFTESTSQWLVSSGTTAPT